MSYRNNHNRFAALAPNDNSNNNYNKYQSNASSASPKKRVSFAASVKQAPTSNGFKIPKRFERKTF